MVTGKRSALTIAEELAERCRAWNSDHAHQVAAGQVRARQFTPASQMQAGHAGWMAFSARWRAKQGLPPLSAEAAQRYVTIEDICDLRGRPLPAPLRATIYQAWCAGHLFGVAAWLTATPVTQELEQKATDAQ